MTMRVAPSFAICFVRRHLATCALFCVLSLVPSCRHKAVTSPIPGNAPTADVVESLQPDQVNIAGWDKAWTNLLNDAEQSFKPAFSKLLAVEVDLVVGDPGALEDELTLTLLDEAGQSLAVVTQNVQSAKCDRATFMMPKEGIEVSPGLVYRLKLSGGTTFGWKYIIGGYEKGEAMFNGKPLLSDARSTFLFRTFGVK